MKEHYNTVKIAERKFKNGGTEEENFVAADLLGKHIFKRATKTLFLQ